LIWRKPLLTFLWLYTKSKADHGGISLMSAHKSLRVVVFREEDLYVAQCLEHDICVQADSLPKLQKRFEATLRLEGDDLDLIDPAPPRFHDLWASAEALESEDAQTEMRLAA
jgi:hypothetical protein